MILQVAFLAPTRLLAIQHYKSMQDRFPNLKIACLHAGVKYEQAKIIKQNVTSGYIQVRYVSSSLLRDTTFIFLLPLYAYYIM